MRHYVSILTGLLSISPQHNSFLSGKHLSWNALGMHKF